jgi:hypothetical protein
MGRRLRGGGDIQARNGNLIITDLVGSTRHAYANTTVNSKHKIVVLVDAIEVPNEENAA